MRRKTKHLTPPLPTSINVKSVEASRAIFVHQDQIPLTRIKFTLDDDATVEFDLTIHQATALIEEMMAAYNAIVPVLKTSRGGFGL